ncbi:MAG: YfiR family protein [Deltaproteobacteria bacterium]|nr:YfiR family protein [Deltaproteobacteria bacterium]
MKFRKVKFSSARFIFALTVLPLIGYLHALSNQCATFECQVKAALVVRIVTLVQGSGNINFCVSKKSPIRELIQIGFNENQNNLANTRLLIVEIPDKSCDLYFIDDAFTTQEINQISEEGALVISNGLDHVNFSVKITKDGKTFSLTVNPQKLSKGRLRFDPSLLRLAKKLVGTD